MNFENYELNEGQIARTVAAISGDVALIKDALERIGVFISNIAFEINSEGQEDLRSELQACPKTLMAIGIFGGAEIDENLRQAFNEAAGQIL